MPFHCAAVVPGPRVGIGRLDGRTNLSYSCLAGWLMVKSAHANKDLTEKIDFDM
jgi:hypothetical protein